MDLFSVCLLRGKSPGLLRGTLRETRGFQILKKMHKILLYLERYWLIVGNVIIVHMLNNLKNVLTSGKHTVIKAMTLLDMQNGFIFPSNQIQLI